MNLDNLFRNQPKFPRNLTNNQHIDIEQNTQSIIYKYYEDPKPSKEKGNQIHKPIQNEKLSKQAFSPQNTKQVIEQKLCFNRCKQNILYQFQNYVVYNKLLGEGSFSKVYIGQMKRNKKLVAIKEVQNLQQNEIACLMNSQSPYVIKLHGFWNVAKHSYIALQLCEGSLRQILDKISTEDKIQYFQQIVQGMNYLFKKNIIHRDLKFQNILIKDGIAKISDFGFAKPIGSKLAVFSKKCGTPYTMAPQIYFHCGEGKTVYTHKCDIYSLGVILHQMLYSKHPFDYCADKMKNNKRVLVNKKFGYLDILIQRCLQLQVSRRCNWSQFIQIFSLFTMKKNNQTLEVHKLTNRIANKNINKRGIVYQVNEDNQFKKAKQEDKLLRYKKNIYHTPQKVKANERQIQKQLQSPFHKIRIIKGQNIFQKAEGQKPLHEQQKKQNQRFSTEKQQEWKAQHDKMYEKQIQKQGDQQNEAISAVKLVALILMVLLIVTLLQKDFD